MLRQRRSPRTSHTMIRSASLLVMTGALWAGAAHAQMSGADLVTRIDRLQAQVRELTGTVEELQYRNQQLEQELQRKSRKDARENSIGLGYRVPLLIASPWSRGGCVCSQVFDHTSSLQFLEKFPLRQGGQALRLSNFQRPDQGNAISGHRQHGQRS